MTFSSMSLPLNTGILYLEQRNTQDQRFPCQSFVLIQVPQCLHWQPDFPSEKIRHRHSQRCRSRLFTTKKIKKPPRQLIHHLQILFVTKPRPRRPRTSIEHYWLLLVKTRSIPGRISRDYHCNHPWNVSDKTIRSDTNVHLVQNQLQIYHCWPQKRNLHSLSAHLLHC